MATTVDHTQDYLVWANREAVALTSVLTAGNATQTIAEAKRRPVSFKEQQASYGVYTAGDTNFHLPAVLTTGTPKPRDVITDTTGVAWTVLEALKVNLGSVWKCVCRALAIANGLKDLITIEVPGVDQGSTGARFNVAWIPVYSNIPARVQPDGETIEDYRGKRATVRKLLIYLDRQVVPTNAAGDYGRVKHTVTTAATGNTAATITVNYYEIENYRDAERIGDLPVLECTDDSR